MKAIVVMGAIVLALVGGAYGYFQEWPKYQVRERVKAALNDPESASFGAIEIDRSTRAGCGTVNAKNRMGGYVGETLFVAAASGEVRFAPSDTADFGIPEMRLQAVKKRVDFLEFGAKHCPLAKVTR